MTCRFCYVNIPVHRDGANDQTLSHLSISLFLSFSFLSHTARSALPGVPSYPGIPLLVSFSTQAKDGLLNTHVTASAIPPVAIAFFLLSYSFFIILSLHLGESGHRTGVTEARLAGFKITQQVMSITYISPLSHSLFYSVSKGEEGEGTAVKVPLPGERKSNDI